MAFRGVRFAVLLIIAGVLATLVVWRATRKEPLGGGPASRDPATARVEQYRREGNLEALAGEADDPRAEVATRAVRAMGTLGPAAVPHLERRIADARPEVREAAVVAWGQAADDRRPEVVAAAARTDPSVIVRATAVSVLGQVRAVNEMETLIAALDDPDHMVRVRASASIERIVGRRYEVYLDDPPGSDRRREAVENVRKIWAEEGQGVRDYYAAKKARGER
ncbi:MAG: HEAT repeat domain-containing protein [Planctomycetota bacterium]|nr:HEAT repeat domain-containing protein [Planctomycetota bacterium]